jgi:hypothetical protein
MGQEIKLRMVRLTFPELFEAVEFKAGDGKFRFDASFLVVPGSENDKIINAAILAAAKETFEKPGEAEKRIASFANNSNKNCYLSGDNKEYEGYQGMMVLSSHRKQKDGRPGVFDVTRAGPDGKPLPLSIADGKPYSGCYVHALLDIYCQGGENPGIRCGLRGVFFAKDGDAFSGSKVASPDSFDVEEGANACEIG